MSVVIPSLRAAIAVPPWVKNELWRRAQAVPSLDLRFADNKSLVDAVTGASLVTSTRASSGTFVGSNGVLQTAVTNLLLQSSNFLTTWTKDAGVTITADSSQGAPFSGVDVYRVDYTGANQNGPSQTITYLAVTYTASIWIKGTAGETIRFSAQTGTQAINFTLTGAWQRLTQTWTGVAAGAAFTINTFDSVTARTIYIAGAQLEQASSVGEYIPTTSAINSAPRFDHNPTTGESLGLLVEEQRANLCLQSAAISTSPWAANGAETCVASTLTDPAGGLNAFKINTSTSPFDRWQQAITVVNGTTYTLSAWVRSTTGTTLFRLRFAGGVASSDLTATTTWQRFTYTLTAATTAGFFAFNSPSTGAAAEIHVWGAQLEAGAFPTSYIPTTTAAATRSADVCSITGSAFSSWYRQDEGTVFAEYAGQNGGRTFMADDGTTNNRFENRITANTSQLSSWSANIQVIPGLFAPAATGLVDGVRVKTALALKVDDAAISTNGIAAGTDTSCAMPVALNRMILGSFQGSATFLNGTIRRLSFWPQRLANSVLQNITQ
jgi:hypothetical protein